MRTLIRFLPGVVAGLILGWLVARYAIRQPPAPSPPGGTVPLVSTQRFNLEKKADARRTELDATAAWEGYLAKVLPPSQIESAATARAKMQVLRQQAAQKNPIRAEVEREWLLLQVPTSEIAALAKDVEPWPNAGAAFSALLGRWAAHDPKGALAFARTLPAADIPRGTEAVLSRWVESDPKTALAYLESAHFGHIYVQKDQVRRTLSCGDQRHPAAGKCQHTIAIALQYFLQKLRLAL